MANPVSILINPRAHQGKALRKWESIRAHMLKSFPGVREIFVEPGFDLQGFLALLPEGTLLISAGGDGSVNYLVNAILKQPGLNKKLSIGAIGLGSSNDFHKPFRCSLHNIPIRTNARTAKWCDVGKILYEDGCGTKKEKYFIVNASFGATAEGNWKFNNPGLFLKWLKKTSTAAAIHYTSLVTILGFRNRSCRIQSDSIDKTTRVSNINILKIPYVAGSLHYDQSISQDDGRMGLHICEDLSRWELVDTLMGLQKGRFKQNNKRSSTYTGHFLLESKKPVTVECDGETEKATRIEITLLPKALKILSA
jgi:diacylglycerol kinase family enzyme